jgi:two-component system response regulator FixJ
MNASETIDIIDDVPSLREALALLLETEGFIVRTYAKAGDFLNRASSTESSCVLTDVRMPDMTGLELLSRMKDMRCVPPVIVMTAYPDVSLAVRAMKTGAVDFIEKPFDDKTLLTAVRSAILHNGATRRRDAEIEAVRERLACLTPRENDVLAGLVKGNQNKIIAHELGISVRTVETHRAKIMEKARAGSLSELVRMSLLTGQGEGSAKADH